MPKQSYPTSPTFVRALQPDQVPALLEHIDTLLVSAKAFARQNSLSPPLAFKAVREVLFTQKILVQGLALKDAPCAPEDQIYGLGINTPSGSFIVKGEGVKPDATWQTASWPTHQLWEYERSFPSHGSYLKDTPDPMQAWKNAALQAQELTHNTPGAKGSSKRRM